ncbi:MAG TPA: DUF3618 domain-containing protein [Mycobacteriales bacterium]|nr:DUF3618 domain-containing protein [Mycobacteriales bacterium]
MGASPEQLEREIERTRAELAQTIGAIEEKVSPARIKARLSPARFASEHKPMLAALGGGIAALMTLLVVRKARSHR